ncbi:MAG: 30S ribosomal protein S19 [Phycisphaerales bacterium]|nr:30S ribosomal protein S19 [Phycisphaerales bacterium]
MGRSLKKGPFVDEKLYRRVENLNATRKKEPLKTWSRRCTIVPEFVGHTFKVHNGRAFLDVFVTEDMVGHKLGEFSSSRTFRGHTNKKEGIEGSAAPAAPAAPAGKK